MADSQHRHGCQRADHPNIGRRRLLQVGGMALFGTSMADLLRLEAQKGRTPARGSTAPGEIGRLHFPIGRPLAARDVRSQARCHRRHSRRVRHDPNRIVRSPLLRIFAAAGGACRQVFHRSDDASPVRPAVPQRAQQQHLSAAHRNRRNAGWRHQYVDRQSPAWPIRMAVDWFADRLRQADGCGSRVAGGYRDSARKFDAVSRARLGHSRPALRPLGSRSGAAVPRTRRRRFVPQLLQP